MSILDTPLAKRLFMLLGTGLVLMFFSEYLFVNEGPSYELVATLSDPLKLLWILFEFGAFYTFIFGVWVLVAIHIFNIRSIWALFLAAIFYGWAAEGVLIPLIYTESYVWTGIAWHATIDVLLGWYVLRVILQKNNILLSSLSAIALGLFWGYYATWIALGEAGVAGLIEVGAFIPFTFVATSILILGNILIDRFGGTEFKPTNVEIGIYLTVTTLLWIGFILFTIGPLALGLPLGVALICLVLYKNKKSETRPNILSTFHKKITLPNYFVLYLTPVVASITYGIAHASGIVFPLGVFIDILILFAYVMIALSVYKILTMKKRTLSTAQHK